MPNSKIPIAASLVGSIKASKFYATAAKYDSSLEASLDADNISVDVYDNLIETVNKNLHLLHRYLKLRKKALKLDELHMYDLYVPIVEESKKNIPYEEALKMVEAGLRPLGKNISRTLRKAYKRLDRCVRKPGQNQRRIFMGSIHNASICPLKLPGHNK